MRRRYRLGRTSEALSIEELRRQARSHLPGFAFEFIDGGAEDESALSRNRAAFDALRFAPATLAGVADRHTRTTLLGTGVAAPLVVAPTGMNGLARHEADLQLARAAAAAGVPFTLSTVSNVRLERIAAEVGGTPWMQLYTLRDRAANDDLLRRARDAGYGVLVVTSDAVVHGRREWDQRHYSGPGRLAWRSRLDCLRHPRWLAGTLLRHGLPTFANLVDYLPPGVRGRTAMLRAVPGLIDRGLTWDDLARLRDTWTGRLLLKGVMRGDDAARAADLGCDGIVVSNHGGRQLDTCAAPIEVLPGIVERVAGRMSVLLDSGVRRGSDVIRAVALGADAVLVGRAPLYGMAAGGEAGATRALAILVEEMERTLGQLGCRSFADVGPHLLHRADACAPPAGMGETM